MGYILRNLPIGDPSNCGWFEMAIKFAVGILLGTAYIDRFISGISSSKRKVLFWYSRPVAITAKPKTSNNAQRTNLVADKPVSNACHNKTKNDLGYDVVQAAKKL